MSCSDDSVAAALRRVDLSACTMRAVIFSLRRVVATVAGRRSVKRYPNMLVLAVALQFAGGILAALAPAWCIAADGHVAVEVLRVTPCATDEVAHPCDSDILPHWGGGECFDVPIVVIGAIDKTSTHAVELTPRWRTGDTFSGRPTAHVPPRRAPHRRLQDSVVLLI